MISYRRLIRRAAWAGVIALSTITTAAAATLPAGFSETLVASGLRKPTAMTFAPDGRLFICEQEGTLRVVKNGALLATPFLTVAVNASGERGLLGVAFDPNFASNRYVYVYYTATSPTVHNRVSRFIANGDVAQAGSEVPLLDLETLSATNHNGGAIHFGPDGKLYVAVGDNANRENAQVLTNRLGKILRINADGSIPSNNPFFTTATGVNRSIWALGLRNPYTFATQPVTGRLLINDVGESTWEEVNEGVAGANYGWPATEGATTDPAFRTPIYAYDHGSGCAISGAAFHNLLNSPFPPEYWGAFFFADFCGGWIRAIAPNSGTMTAFASGISKPVDLATASDGSLYYLARGAGTDTGVVYRVSYAVTSPSLRLTANGVDGPLYLGDNDPLQVLLTFNAGSATVDVDAYVGVFTPLGTYWVNPAMEFVPTMVPMYSGLIGAFGPSSFVHLSSVANMPAGPYWWFVVMDSKDTQSPTYSDILLTVVP